MKFLNPMNKARIKMQNPYFFVFLDNAFRVHNSFHMTTT